MERQQKIAKAALIILGICTVFVIWNAKEFLYAGFVFAVIGGPFTLLFATFFMLLGIVIILAPLVIACLFYRRAKFLIASAISVIGLIILLILIPVETYLSKSSASVKPYNAYDAYQTAIQP